MPSTVHTMTATVIAPVTVTVIAYNQRMARWDPNAQGRLEQAALELYVERGFEQTTVAEIAARAGLTERTFFRHFADKREVLFWGAEQLVDTLVGVIRAAPASEAPLAVVLRAVEAAAAWLESVRDLPAVRARHAIVSAHSEL